MMEAKMALFQSYAEIVEIFTDFSNKHLNNFWITSAQGARILVV